MNIATYIDKALSTEKGAENGQVFRLRHAMLGQLSEFGELLDAFKKVAIYGKPFDPVNFLEELGDLAWYSALGMASVNAREVLTNEKNPDPDAPAEPSARYDHALTVVAGSATEFAKSVLNDAHLSKLGLLLASEGLTVAAIREVQDYVEIVYDAVMEGKSEIDADDAQDLTIHFLASFAFIGGMAELHGSSLTAVLAANIAKLEKRYGGAFTEKAATQRDLAGERAVLESGLAA